MVETQTNYKCSACGMTKAVPTTENAPTCCGKTMQEAAARNSAGGNEGSCCSG